MVLYPGLVRGREDIVEALKKVNAVPPIQRGLYLNSLKRQVETLRTFQKITTAEGAQFLGEIRQKRQPHSGPLIQMRQNG
ncbi:MAG: hypothetical protein XU15_C0011G0130 [candidate division NC10 bacterium CSP1-5]|nr:MAG: hypothetical protein XU15_C0011G0130 [candidate division NC10 bacterium CSP1-5]